MTSIWSNSIHRKSSLSCNVPKSLQATLIRVQQQHYEELYELDAEATTSLQDALDNVLSSFQSHNPTLSHLRYVWMALILACVVEPTVKYYQPDNSIPEETINKIAIWLVETLAELLNNQARFAKVAKQAEDNTIGDALYLFTKNKDISSFQILSEALDVYKNAIRTLDAHQSFAALLDILDDCLEGYAMFPGSDGRRELFDWWLLEVVPASWYLYPPKSIYSINDLSTEKNITSRQISKLKKISYAIRSLILAAVEDGTITTTPAFCNTFDSSLNKIEVNIIIEDNYFILDKVQS